jgi:hypothetical protein
MKEKILNIYLVINKGFVEEFRAVGYEQEGDDDEKISFLKSRVREDFSSAYRFDSPRNKFGQFMPYRKFSKLESTGRQYQLFEEIFSRFSVPENPLICVTPVVDGEILASE